MTRGEIATTPSTRRGCILPLPEEVVAHIKSSTAIVSLTGVVLELLKNSLDARATKIEATVDFARGGCTIEDDGLGISPLEFREAGGLGKLYCTSKYYAGEALLGRNGTFLASLAAMSLLTITSRHHQHRSNNAITFHHSKVIERQLPASATHQVHGKHGTRVSVRNLFGNLPVRVKQRSIVLEQKTEQDRLWGVLKRDVAGLLLSWRQPVSLKIRDGDNRVVLNLNISNSTVAVKEHYTDARKPCSAQLSPMLNVLTQASYITIDEWSSWVPASASTASLSIKGAISLDPAPSKHVQFISLGIRPLSASSGHNELYDEVNRLFALSSFGSIEDNAEMDDMEKTRRQSDNQLVNNQYTNRQLKARKDVDRYAMFHLCISLKESRSSKPLEDHLVDDEANLQTVMEILGAMITQWLSVHHFRPRQPRKKRVRPGTASTSLSDSTEGDSLSTTEGRDEVIAGDRIASRTVTPRPSSVSTSARKRKRPTSTTAHEPSEALRHRAFAEWSRIKSGKANFFDNLPTLPKLKTGKSLETTWDGQRTNSSTVCHSTSEGLANFEVEPVPRGALSIQTLPEEASAPANDLRPDNDVHDDTILWTDPSTKKTYMLNARTGCVISDARPRLISDHTAPSFATSRKDSHKSLRLVPKSATATAKKTPFLDGVLHTWDNPIFKPSERRIQQIALHEREFDNGNHQQPYHHCTRIDVDKAFNDVSATGSSRLSKEGLQRAEVIAQVDRKFILVKMKRLSESKSSEELPVDLLVLVDQHAADERIRVESLLQELCTPIAQENGQSGYQSKLGHRAQVASILVEKPIQFAISTQERIYFTTHAARFAAWGILFDTLQSTSTTNRHGHTAKDECLLSVTALPPAISERCKADAQVLISFLRSTVWKYVGDPHLPPLPISTSTADGSDWVRRLATCPPGLIDLLNSRACRSAIMFNDELSLEQCKDLVRKLAGCVFPFMCAHGRPSMVPLVDLGKVEGIAQGMDIDSPGKDDGFVQAWKDWKR